MVIIMTNTNTGKFRDKRAFLNEYADHMEKRGNASYSSTIHVYDAKDAMGDYQLERVAKKRITDDGDVGLEKGAICFKKIKKMVGSSK